MEDSAENSAPAAPTASSAAPAASPATSSAPPASTPDALASRTSGPVSSSPESALAALEKVAALSAEVNSSPTSPDDTGEGRSPAPTEPARSAPVSAIPRSTDAPENRIQAAVRNARVETRAEVEQELGWARTLGPKEEIERYVNVARRLFSDPQAFYAQLGS